MDSFLVVQWFDEWVSAEVKPIWGVIIGRTNARCQLKVDYIRQVPKLSNHTLWLDKAYNSIRYVLDISLLATTCHWQWHWFDYLMSASLPTVGEQMDEGLEEMWTESMKAIGEIDAGEIWFLAYFIRCTLGTILDESLFFVSPNCDDEDTHLSCTCCGGEWRLPRIEALL